MIYLIIQGKKNEIGENNPESPIFINHIPRTGDRVLYEDVIYDVASVLYAYRSDGADDEIHIFLK